MNKTNVLIESFSVVEGHTSDGLVLHTTGTSPLDTLAQVT